MGVSENMYAILEWVTNEYVTFIHKQNGSIRMWNTLAGADEWADSYSNSDKLRVISVDSVRE